MKRLFVLLAALAALSTVVAANAFAAGGGNTTCNSDWVNTVGWVKVSGNLDVPAGATCKFSGEVTGNVTVEGDLRVFGSTFDKNVIVNGGQFQSGNYGSWIHGNLNITNSQGSYMAGDQNGFWSDYSPSHIDGNVNLSGNQIPLYFQGTTLIKGTINNDNTGAGITGQTPVQNALH
jgi:hypothetical protein